jgi:predicted Zn-dependent peptidase
MKLKINKTFRKWPRKKIKKKRIELKKIKHDKLELKE